MSDKSIDFLTTLNAIRRYETSSAGRHLPYLNLCEAIDLLQALIDNSIESDRVSRHYPVQGASEIDDDDDETLKPCPFCGAPAQFDKDTNGWAWIECTKCQASTNRSASLMDDCHPLLLEKWNARRSE